MAEVVVCRSYGNDVPLQLKEGELIKKLSLVQIKYLSVFNDWDHWYNYSIKQFERQIQLTFIR